MQANKNKEALLTVERLKEMLSYNPDTGSFTWIASRRPGRWNNKSAGGVNSDGYIMVSCFGQSYLAHRLAWLYMKGTWPGHQVDHKNGKRADNRWENLRAATNRFNQENLRKARKDNSCGVLGVSHDKRAKKNPWRACITVDSKKECLGRFATPEEAHEVYLQAKRSLHQGCTI